MSLFYLFYLHIVTEIFIVIEDPATKESASD